MAIVTITLKDEMTNQGPRVRAVVSVDTDGDDPEAPAPLSVFTALTIQRKLALGILEREVAVYCMKELATLAEAEESQSRPSSDDQPVAANVAPGSPASEGIHSTDV